MGDLTYFSGIEQEQRVRYAREIIEIKKEFLKDEWSKLHIKQLVMHMYKSVFKSSDNYIEFDYINGISDMERIVYSAFRYAYVTGNLYDFLKIFDITFMEWDS